MITIDGYSIEYSKKNNRVVIYLPALWTTARTTFDKISYTRKEEVSDKELAQILMLSMAVFENQIEKLPTVEPERKKGKWINGTCNQCGNHAPHWAMASTYYRSNFCPNCGADMRGEKDE